MRSRLRTRVRECPLVLAHPRRLLSSVFVSRSGSWSRMNMGPTSGTWTLGRSAGRWPVCRPWRQLTMETWLCVLASLLSDGLSWCRLLVESAWSSVLSRSRVARRPLVRMAVWLHGGLTEGYSSVSALGSTVDTCSATVGF